MRISKLLHILTPVFLFTRYTYGFTSNRFTNRLISSSVISMRAKKNAALDNIHDAFMANSRKMSPVYTPKSDNQKLYVDFLRNSTIPIVLGIGPAGCGKTLFACVTAINSLRSGDIDKIILTRPIVPVEEEEIGFLPGNLVHKMDPWTRPIFDIFLEFYTQRELDSMIQSGVIEISPLAFMRGRTFKRAFIIADEMQNSTPNQMLMLTTRIGEKTKMVITGDLNQSDRSLKNGLLDIMKRIREQRRIEPELAIKMIEMCATDIERSPIVAKILDMYIDRPVVLNKDNIRSLDTNNSENLKPIIENLDIVKKEDSVIRPTYENPDIKKPLFNGSPNDAAMVPISHLSSRF